MTEAGIGVVIADNLDEELEEESKQNENRPKPVTSLRELQKREQ